MGERGLRVSGSKSPGARTDVVVSRCRSAAEGSVSQCSMGPSAIALGTSLQESEQCSTPKPTPPSAELVVKPSVSPTRTSTAITAGEPALTACGEACSAMAVSSYQAPLQERSSTIAHDTAIGGAQVMFPAGSPAHASGTGRVQGIGQVVGEGEEWEMGEWMLTHRRKVQAPQIALAVLEACPGPPLWTAEEGRQGTQTTSGPSHTPTAPSQSAPPVRRPPRIPLGTVAATTTVPLLTAIRLRRSDGSRASAAGARHGVERSNAGRRGA